MRKFWQKAWFEIPFNGNLKVSENSLAGDEFYREFYKIFFSRYTGYEDLDPVWKLRKEEVAHFLLNQCHDDTRVLSIGCGIGFIEQFFHLNKGASLALDVEDFDESILWLKSIIPSENIQEMNEASIKADKGLKYDLIYACAVDYVFDESSFVQFLADIKGRLKPGGECIIISASFINSSSLYGSLSISLKGVIKLVLSKLKLYNRGQFWGWLRTKADYRAAMQSAGYTFVMDGFIPSSISPTYFIKGRRV